MNSPFSRLLLDGLDGERHGRCQRYGPFRVVFRLAGIPHLDEIAPRGVRLYGIEIRPAWQTWQKRLADSSSALDAPREHYRDDARCFPSVHLCAT